MANIKVTFTHEHKFFGPLVVTASVDPGRPAPSCSNPSSSAYSDPGDPAYAEIKKVMWGSYDITETLCELVEKLADEAIEQAKREETQHARWNSF